MDHRALDPRTPVLVGVGTALDLGVEAVDLMAEAARAAAADAGRPDLLARVQWVGIPTGTWRYLDPCRLVAERIGAPDAHGLLVDAGNPQQTVISRALDAIASGQLDVALVVGGDDRKRSATAERGGPPAPVTVQPEGTEPHERIRPSGEIIAAPEIKLRLVEAVQQFAIYESAMRFAAGQTIAEHLAEVDALWARFNEVAQRNPEAAFPRPMTAADLRSTAGGNRPLSFPYNKWHSTQIVVDQAAAMLLCSVAVARSLGIPSDRWLFQHVGITTSFTVPTPKRKILYRWPGMRLVAEKAAEHLGRPMNEVEFIDIYSCFPGAVRLQMKELRLPADATPTVTGGMAFAGGPFNNYTYQATVAMARILREHPGAFGAITNVSGFMAKAAMGVWSTAPTTTPALRTNYHDEVAARKPALPLHDSYHGPATVVGYTVRYDRSGTPQLVVVGDAADGGRVLATCDDPAVCEEATRVELVNTTVHVEGDVCKL